jgi:hypothetical protein
MSRELLQQALDALEHQASFVDGYYAPIPAADEAATAIRAHLAQPPATSADYAMGYAEGFNDACKPAQTTPVPEEFDLADDGGCPVCGEDGGTSCGMPNCGLLSAPPVPQAEPVAWQQRWTNPGVNPNVSPEEVDWKPLELKGRTEAETLRDLVAYTFDGRPCYEVRALYTHPAASVPVPPGWMPIETAPKDGRTLFVVQGFNVKGRTTTYTTDPYCVWPDERAGWIRWPHEFSPTHWMPLPPPPGIAASLEVP